MKSSSPYSEAASQCRVGYTEGSSGNGEYQETFARQPQLPRNSTAEENKIGGENAAACRVAGVSLTSDGRRGCPPEWDRIRDSQEPIASGSERKESTVRGIVDIVSQPRFGTQMSLGRSTPPWRRQRRWMSFAFSPRSSPGGWQETVGVAHLHLCSSVVASPHQLCRIKPTFEGLSSPWAKKPELSPF